MAYEEKLNRIREVLQLMALKIIYDKNLFENLAFGGGSALRIIFNSKRFSEDLDFSLVNKKGYTFLKLTKELVRGFALYGLQAESHPDRKKTVNASMFKFSGLLKDLGLSALPGQKISIKLEVDTNPPGGWVIENTAVNKLYLLNIPHFDLPSMFATKLHACFFRKFTKGRDLYDFIWYLSKGVKPNYVLLNNAIEQTEHYKPKLDETNIRDFLLKNLTKLDFSAAKKDAERFLEDKSELRIFALSIFKDTINSVFSQ